MNHSPRFLVCGRATLPGLAPAASNYASRPAIPILKKPCAFSTMIRVGDLDRSIAFYTGNRHAIAAPPGLSDGRFTLAFVGYGSEDQAHSGTDPQLGYAELRPGQRLRAYRPWPCPTPQRLAPRSRHVAARSCARQAPMKHGSTIIAFVDDPDGYKIELIQRG